MVMTYSFDDYIRLTAITYQSFGLDKKQRTSYEVLCFLAVRLILEPLIFVFIPSATHNNTNYL